MSTYLKNNKYKYKKITADFCTKFIKLCKYVNVATPKYSDPNTNF